MKLPPTLATLLAACAVFILAPYIPSWILQLAVGTNVGALLMLVLVLVVLQTDIVLGLSVFLAVAALFLENRRRTVKKVTAILATEKAAPLEVKELSTPAPNLVPGELHPEREGSYTEDVDFQPTEDSGKNDVEDLGLESQDEKQPLETVPPQPSIVSELMQQKGLATI
jgi:hypothetical protein